MTSEAAATAPAAPSPWRTVVGAVVMWRLVSLAAGILLGPRLAVAPPLARLLVWSAWDSSLMVGIAFYGWRLRDARYDPRTELRARPGLLAASAGLGVATAAANVAVNIGMAGLRGGEGLALGGAVASLVDASAGWATFWVSAALMLLAAPWAEEALYRGFIQRTLGRERWPAVIFSSALFWNFHAHAVWTPAPFFLGLVLALVYGHTGSLGAAIACHTANNAVAVLLALALRLR